MMSAIGFIAYDIKIFLISPRLFGFFFFFLWWERAPDSLDNLSFSISPQLTKFSNIRPYKDSEYSIGSAESR